MTENTMAGMLDDRSAIEVEGVWPELAEAYHKVTTTLEDFLRKATDPKTAYACYHAVASEFATTDPAWPHLAALVADVLASWTDSGRLRVMNHQTWAVLLTA